MLTSPNLNEKCRIASKKIRHDYTGPYENNGKIEPCLLSLK